MSITTSSLSSFDTKEDVFPPLLQDTVVVRSSVYDPLQSILSDIDGEEGDGESLIKVVIDGMDGVLWLPLLQMVVAVLVTVVVVVCLVLALSTRSFCFVSLLVGSVVVICCCCFCLEVKNT